MRIAIDLQACQSQSAHRGIGRYSLSLINAMLKINATHEIFIVLSGAFPNTIAPLRAHFSKRLPKAQVVVWHAPFPLNEHHQLIPECLEAACLLREAFLEQLQPDVILIASLFEGFGDNALTSIGKLQTTTPTAVILYDLIPMLYPDLYLTHPPLKQYYDEKIAALQKATLLLSISASAKEEAHAHLAPTLPIEVISSAAETHFKKITYTKVQKDELLAQFHLKKDFLMYTGGIDPRKNIEGLITAYAKLPQALLNTHQLAIVCAVKPNERIKLNKHLVQLGLTENDVIITGYVQEEELVALYNFCKAFIFPSIHEGFGLPILEAMQCGVPVIGSNRSSLPEAIGHDEALFDPTSTTEMTEKIIRVLTDEPFRKMLITHAADQVTLFSWEKTAAKTLQALETLKKPPLTPKTPAQKRKLAFVSPLPPTRTGIAEYSSVLLPALAEYYEIDVIVENTEINRSLEKLTEASEAPYCIRSVNWLKQHANDYERILYQVGNSTFHTYQLECMKTIPGVVVLHDFYLSSVISYLEMIQHKTSWSEALYHYGYDALFFRHHLPDLSYLEKRYPCNIEVIESAIGMIVHSDESLRLAKQWLNEPHDKPWFKIPLPKSLNTLTKANARQRLHLPDNAFITASFGFLAPNKKNLEILATWAQSNLRTQPHHYLIFVGKGDAQYEQTLKNYIAQECLESRVIITGWTDDALFEHYLKAADLAIQLRTDTRGETSAAVLDCLASGLPTLVNAHGAMNDLPDDVVVKLKDTYHPSELMTSLETLATNAQLRDTLSARAIDYIKTHHEITPCAKAYFHAIEQSYASLQPYTLLKRIQQVGDFSHKDWLLILENVVMNQPPRAIKHLLVDITHWEKVPAPQNAFYEHLLRQLIHHPPQGYRVEPIYHRPREHCFRYARSFMSQWLGFPIQGFSDEVISTRREDVYLSLLPLTSARQPLVDVLQRRGVTLAADESELQAYLNHHFPYHTWAATPQEAI